MGFIPLLLHQLWNSTRQYRTTCVIMHMYLCAKSRSACGRSGRSRVQVHVVKYESIHEHNAYAQVEQGR